MFFFVVCVAFIACANADNSALLNAAVPIEDSTASQGGTEDSLGIHDIHTQLAEGANVTFTEEERAIKQSLSATTTTQAPDSVNASELADLAGLISDSLGGDISDSLGGDISHLQSGECQLGQGYQGFGCISCDAGFYSDEISASAPCKECANGQYSNSNRRV